MEVGRREDNQERERARYNNNRNPLATGIMSKGILYCCKMKFFTSHLFVFKFLTCWYAGNIAPFSCQTEAPRKSTRLPLPSANGAIG